MAKKIKAKRTFVYEAVEACSVCNRVGIHYSTGKDLLSMKQKYPSKMKK
jgi:hypothetical protein